MGSRWTRKDWWVFTIEDGRVLVVHDCCLLWIHIFGVTGYDMIWCHALSGWRSLGRICCCSGRTQTQPHNTNPNTNTNTKHTAPHRTTRHSKRRRHQNKTKSIERNHHGRSTTAATVTTTTTPAAPRANKQPKPRRRRHRHRHRCRYTTAIVKPPSQSPASTTLPSLFISSPPPPLPPDPSSRPSSPRSPASASPRGSPPIHRRPPTPLRPLPPFARRLRRLRWQLRRDPRPWRLRQQRPPAPAMQEPSVCLFYAHKKRWRNGDWKYRGRVRSHGEKRKMALKEEMGEVGYSRHRDGGVLAGGGSFLYACARHFRHTIWHHIH